MAKALVLLGRGVRFKVQTSLPHVKVGLYHAKVTLGFIAVHGLIKSKNH